MTTDSPVQPVNDISRITDLIMERELLGVPREEAEVLVRTVIESAGEALKATPQYGVLTYDGRVDTSYNGGFRSLADAQYAAENGYRPGAAIRALSRTTIIVHTDWT
ncbi:hypothetical protein [Paenarthrobacter sp. C1]|uniref:hypothetical protein n=1 Tax=Paenarthrobacter sp. C1 TaxID=3400220 RepID=UPI003BF4C4C6